MTEQSPRPKPGVLLYEDFGTGRHRESSLVRHALGSTHDEALVAGLAGGIGFMYFVFEYAGHPPLLTIVERRFGAPGAFLAGTRRLYACLEEEWTAPGATRPLYADFLDVAGRPEAAALFRDSARHWSRLAELARAADPDADAAGRRALFDECAGLVDRSLHLERWAVTLL